MTFYPLNSSQVSSSQDYKVSAFTDLPYSMQDIISNHLEKLRELEISGRGTLFCVTKQLLPKEEDSSTTKIIKAFLMPATAITMGFTAIVDHTLKYVKNDSLEELGRNLERCKKASNNIRKLILQCNFKSKYQEELEKYRVSIALNRDLIEKTERKLHELQSLSIHSSLKAHWEQNLIENKTSLISKNSELQHRYSNLYNFKEELSKIQRNFQKLELDIEETPQEKRYNSLCMQFDTSSEKLKAYTPINISKICSEIDDFEISNPHWYL